LVTISVRARAIKYKRQFADLPVILVTGGFNQLHARLDCPLIRVKFTTAKNLNP
jgi:hypothetical protein